MQTRSAEGKVDQPGELEQLQAPEAFLDPFLASPLSRMVLGRARARAALVAVDIVRFTAACPACGADCEWTQERQETRVRSTMDCPCDATF